jgi:hypothetical protein
MTNAISECALNGWLYYFPSKTVVIVENDHFPDGQSQCREVFLPMNNECISFFALKEKRHEVTTQPLYRHKGASRRSRRNCSTYTRTTKVR